MDVHFCAVTQNENSSCMKLLQKAFIVFGSCGWYVILSYLLVFMDSWKQTMLLRFSNEVWGQTRQIMSKTRWINSAAAKRKHTCTVSLNYVQLIRFFFLWKNNNKKNPNSLSCPESSLTRLPAVLGCSCLLASGGRWGKCPASLSSHLLPLQKQDRWPEDHTVKVWLGCSGLDNDERVPHRVKSKFKCCFDKSRGLWSGYCH